MASQTFGGFSRFEYFGEGSTSTALSKFLPAFSILRDFGPCIEIFSVSSYHGFFYE